MSGLKKTPGYVNAWTLWFERLMGLLVLANLLFVGFDWSYVKLRPFYLRSHLWLQETFRQKQSEQFLNTVEELKSVLAQDGLNSADAINLLEELRQQSKELFQESPWQILATQASWQEVQKKLIDHVQKGNINQAIDTFWSQEYLAKKGWQQELAVFEREMSYLIGFSEPKLFYDPIKGIEPNRTTQEYLKKVDELKTVLKIEGINGSEVEPLLAELRTLSEEMIDTDPFARVNKSGTLEEIKYKMREYIYARDPNNLPKIVNIQWVNSAIIGVLDWFSPEVLWAKYSAKQSFRTFWSKENLMDHGWEKELDFFDREIRFLMQSNYFRHVGANSDWLDRFWLIDLPWMTLFLGEFIGRIWLLTHQKKMSWGSAISQRWYDLTLWLPVSVVVPGFRWLRVIPVIIRLDQTKFPDLEPIRNRLSMNFIASFAEELTQVVVIRAINQMQEAVETGKFTRSLFEAKTKPKKARIDINDIDEIPEIVNRLLQVTLCQVLPTIQPELEAVVRYQIEKAMKNSAVYQRIHRVPGLGRLPDQIAEGVIAQVTKLVTEKPQEAYISSQNSIPDPIATELSERLVKKFTVTLRQELQREHTLEEIESLLSDLLEEVKLNYVQNLKPEEIPELLPIVKQPPQLTGS
jgi:hypothetical protein